MHRAPGLSTPSPFEGWHARNAFEHGQSRARVLSGYVLIGNQSAAINRAGYGYRVALPWLRRVRTDDSIITAVASRDGSSSSQDMKPLQTVLVCPRLDLADEIA